VPAKAAPAAKPENPPPSNDQTQAKAAPPQKPEPPPEDSNIPRLRRGRPEASDDTEAESTNTRRPMTASSKTPERNPAANSPLQPVSAQAQLIPAVSDADGPDPRPYTYNMKPEEEQAFRSKLLALAADELRGEAREAEAQPASPPRRSRAATAVRSPQPVFDDLVLRAFDVASNNEPVLVMTARAHPAARAGDEATPQYWIALVAGSDLYGQLRKLFSRVTDSEHLDVNPRLELIDAVDADGDGRGELIFRQTFDRGTSYAIYRVTPDRLWPLYEGTPQ
jgi:hypothetical protein